MGNTFNAFVKFISDDPIMLGLCLAIVVLVILFIVVLFIGKKSDKKEELKNDENLETFTNDFKDANIEDFTGPVTIINETTTPTVEEPIEPKVEESIKEVLEVPESNVIEDEEVMLPTLEGTSTSLEEVQEIPVTLEEPIALEINATELGAPTLEEKNDSIDTLTTKEPVNMPTFDDLKITAEPTQPVIDSGETLPVIDEVPSMNIDNMVSIEEAIPEPLDEASIPSIVESSVNPIEENIFDVENNVFKDYTKKEEPIIDEPKEDESIVKEDIKPLEEPIKEAKKESKKQENYNSVYLEDIELPEIVVDEFDKTSILKGIPNGEQTVNEVIETPKVQEEKDDDDLDIDLPKLNPESSNSVINSVKDF